MKLATQTEKPMPNVTFSVILPAFNEEEGIGETLDDLRNTLDRTGAEYELIVVNDSSTDATGERIRRLSGVKASTNEMLTTRKLA